MCLTAMLQGPCAWGIKVLQLNYTRCKYHPIRLSRGSKANTPHLLCAEDAQTTGRSCIPLSGGILSGRDGCFKTAVCLRLLVPAIAVGLLHPLPGVRSSAWAVHPHLGSARSSHVPAVPVGTGSYRGVGEPLLHPLPHPFAALASGAPGCGSGSLALGMSSMVGRSVAKTGAERTETASDA